MMLLSTVMKSSPIAPTAKQYMRPELCTGTHLEVIESFSSCVKRRLLLLTVLQRLSWTLDDLVGCFCSAKGRPVWCSVWCFSQSVVTLLCAVCCVWIWSYTCCNNNRWCECTCIVEHTIVWFVTVCRSVKLLPSDCHYFGSVNVVLGCEEDTKIPKTCSNMTMKLQNAIRY
jgi:hypothetical protein